MSSLYDQDFYQWTIEQANLLKAGALSQLDIENLIEEVESMGKSQKRALESRLTVLLMHLLKWDVQQELQCRSWQSTIAIQRKEIKRLLRANPGLKAIVNDVLPELFEDAIDIASIETGLPKSEFPETCPYTIEQIMGE
ncbi:DUF29 domain-containing protein [Desulfatirhabdium butyrativorans]|uniref:DUF29 domain-containing protein n=1 Tax=Desulfatirhabdium butyrativorans TaxID=340467 RepID=UPI0003FFECA7|nr:DUF29 domain-containing protein [Desulfatirhabdium butyrativorans]